MFVLKKKDVNNNLKMSGITAILELRIEGKLKVNKDKGDNSALPMLSSGNSVCFCRLLFTAIVKRE